MLTFLKYAEQQTTQLRILIDRICARYEYFIMH